VDDTQKRKRIRAYFFTMPKPSHKTFDWRLAIYMAAVLGIGCGFIGTMFGGSRSGNIIIMSAIGIVIGLFTTDFAFRTRAKRSQDAYLKSISEWGVNESDLQPKPTGVDIDHWLSEDLNKMLPLALDKLGLEREELLRDPLLIYGPLFWRTPGIPERDIVGLKDEDGIVRFSCYRVVIICLSDTRVSSYSSNYNFLRDTLVGENTVEYVYRDIVSVSTEERASNYDLPDGKVLRHAQFFRLAVASGDSIEVAITSPEIRDLFGGDPMPTHHEKTVRVIREMLREKKG